MKPGQAQQRARWALWTRSRNTPSTSKKPSPAHLVHHCRCEGLTDPVARAFFERAHRKRTRLYVEDARPACACVYAQIESRGHAPNVSARQGLSNVWIWARRRRSRHHGEEGPRGQEGPRGPPGSGRGGPGGAPGSGRVTCMMPCSPDMIQKWAVRFESNLKALSTM